MGGAQLATVVLAALCGCVALVGVVALLFVAAFALTVVGTVLVFLADRL